jgi:hypothetical protein
MSGEGPDFMVWIKDDEERSARQTKLIRKWANELAVPWAKQLAYMMGIEPKGNFVGKLIMVVGVPICKLIGMAQRIFGKSNKPIGIFKSYSILAILGVISLIASLNRRFTK